MLTEEDRANRRTLMWFGLVSLAAVVIGIIVLVATAKHGAPDPTQQWLDCIQRQNSNPNVYCPAQPPSG